MMAGADEPATLSGLCQPMAIAMVSMLIASIQGCHQRMLLRSFGGMGVGTTRLRG